ncbi:MAG: cupin domain-containing protein [Planctomycetes bacterium]|nr:cupin domain-containing protein [Planctomycetota bacterium]
MGTQATPDITATVLTRERAQSHEAEWGDLRWFANAELGNSRDLTVGRCRLKPGMSNPRHLHPNCDEVLVVLKGRIAHTLSGSSEVELGEGDTISIPRNLAHQARNIGDTDAELMIVFSSAHRQVQGE